MLSGASVHASPSKTSSAPNPASTMSSPGTDAAGQPGSLSGKVVETMDAGGYTYVLIEKKGKKTWVAIPQTTVAVGQQIAFQPGQEMKGFKSTSLKRTFDSIIFSAGVLSEPIAGNAGKKAEAPHAGSKAAVMKPGKKINVEKATGPDAYTVGEIFAQRTKLHKKTVTLKAKVVKVSAAIMGKNWIHLQDGSGDVSQATNNLVATSQDLPAVGDIVTIKGTVYKDKDFGSGYKYKVIMEDAGIQH